MELFSQVFTWVNLHGAEAVAAVLAVMGAFSIIAKWTPTDTDDKIIQFIIDIIHKIGLTKSK